MLPHIGTLAEVIRTKMVMQAFEDLTSAKTKLIVFSDDMDALRKVPDNVPNKEMLKGYIGRPLTRVPDPYGLFNSFGEHNNNKLKQFLDLYNISYEFLSATEEYKKGTFNKTILEIAEKEDEIKQIILKTLKEQRSSSYNPFMPIDSVRGVVIQEGVLNVDPKTGLVSYLDSNGSIRVNPITNGYCKLQWKVDWAMRSCALDIHYEMHGKDLIDSAKIGEKICHILGYKPPLHMMYELFLDQDGKKISKSKGNGLEVDEWLRYSPDETLRYFLFQNPKKARKLYWHEIPKSSDEYIEAVKTFNTLQLVDQRKDHPIWYIHNTEENVVSSPVNFSLLMNLVSITNTDDPEIIWKYIQSYSKDSNPEKNRFLDKMISGTINYYKDHILPKKNYKIPDNREISVLENIISELRKIINYCNERVTNDQELEEMIQYQIYEIGKSWYGVENLKNYFQMFYLVILGQETGPRLPTFIRLYGLENIINLINQKIESAWLLEENNSTETNC